MMSQAALIPLMDAIVRLRFESYSAKILKDLREKTGMTQEQFAEKAGIPLPTLKKWELGKRTPTLEGLAKLGKNLGVYFFAEWDENEKAPDDSGA